MGIVVNLDVIMAKRKMSLNDLSKKVGVTTVNLSILKTGKAKGNGDRKAIFIAKASIKKSNIRLALWILEYFNR